MKHTYFKTKLSAGFLLFVAAIFGVAPAASALHIVPVYRYVVAPTVAGSAYSNATVAATDPSGNTYMAGNFRHAVNFAGASGSDTKTSNIYEAPYVSKHAPDGSYLWTQTIDTDSGGGTAQIYGMATDSAGNVYVAGFFSGGVTFDGPGGTHSQNVTGGASFINKYSPSGSYLSTKNIIPPANGQAVVYGVGFDSADNMYLAGGFSDTVNFGAVAGTTDNKSATPGSADVFVTRVNANGSYGWTRVTSNSNNGYVGASAEAVTPAGVIYVTGGYGGTVNFANGSGSDTQTDNGGGGATYVMAIHADGSYGWSRASSTLSNSGYAGASGIAADPSGNVYTSGTFYDTINFAGASGSDNQSDAGGNGDGFITRYSASGGYGWTKSFDTSGSGASDNAAAVTTDMNGNVYLLHSFNGTINFAGSGGTDNLTGSGSGALTMYESDGSYAWTRSFEPTVGSSAVSSPAGLATDKLGHVFVASTFSGTVNFAGLGGSDSSTMPGNDAFLASYTSFVPGAASGNPPSSAVSSSAGSGSGSSSTATASAAAATTVGAPDTGSGIGSHAPILALSFLAGGFCLISLATAQRRRPAAATTIGTAG